MKTLGAAVAGFMFASFVTAASAAEFQGYVPKGLAQMGETWPGADASDILQCKTLAPSKLHANLSKDAAHEWYGMCANANKVHAQLLSGSCLKEQSKAECRVAVNADNAIRRDPEFWHVVNALMGRADDYGFDD